MDNRERQRESAFRSSKNDSSLITHRATKDKLTGTNERLQPAINRVTGMKVLITAASVAATVGGWAQLAHHDSEAANASQQSATQAVVQANQPLLQIDSLALPTIPPVPTVVPAPDFSSLASRPSGASSQPVVAIPTLAQLPPTPVPPTPMPPTPIPPQPSIQQQPLRQVTVPQPVPRARTRSSR